MDATRALANNLSKFIINPILALIFAAAMIVFIWGVVEFMWGNAKGKPNDDGKQHMLWGLVGMFLMVGAYAILKVIANTLNVSLPN